MCYPKPGPRCTAHTRSAFNAANDAYQANPTSENFEALRSTQVEYDASPGGIRELRRKIEEGSSPVRVQDARTRKGYRKVPRRLSDDDRLRLEVLRDRLSAGTQARVEATEALRNSQAVEEARAAGNIPPVVVSSISLKDPRVPSGSRLYGVEVDYDGYYCSGCSGCEPQEDGEYSDDYCRGSQYHGLRIESVNTRSVLASIFNTSERYISDELVQYANDNGVGDVSSYEVSAYNDYYGENYSVEMSAEVNEKLEQWYWNQPNAVDSDGILPYVRSKGMPTSGLSPLAAIKKQLREENGGRVVEPVEGATSASVQRLKLYDVISPQSHHAQEAEARPATGYNSRDVTGVVVMTGRRSGYVLVDGYHRMNSLEPGKRVADFVVLEGSPPFSHKSV